MNHQKILSLDLTNDILEILHNPLLKHRPFMLRIINFSNEKYELRLDTEGLKELIVLLQNSLESSENSGQDL